MLSFMEEIVETLHIDSLVKHNEWQYALPYTVSCLIFEIQSLFHFLFNKDYFVTTCTCKNFNETLYSDRTQLLKC